MKQIIIILLVLLMSMGLQAAVNYESSSNYIDIDITNSADLTCENGVYYTNLAFPAREVSLEVISSQVSTFDNAGNLIDNNKNLSLDNIAVEETIVMRDLIMHRVSIDIESSQSGNRTVLDNAVIRLQAESEIENIQSISSVFAPLYSKMVDNYETCYLRNLSEEPAKMLIISHDGLDNLSYFTDWKNERGIATEVVNRSDLGATANDIKSYIQSVYDSEEHPPDYLLIIGDVDGFFPVPSFYHAHGVESDVTDQPYTMLDGDDYFPEMIVGRFSIDQSDNLNTIIAKVLNYEKEPYMTDPDWFERMVVVAGNYSDELPVPTTPVTTSMWLAEKARDYGYQDVTEIYYWYPDYPSYPNTNAIKAAINSGAGIVTYRGWGNAWGWNYPYFHTENIQQLTNGLYLPVMTSIVCNTGDFANANVDPCFGELWLTADNKGGVAFVGPSNLHTSTRYNNAIFAGFYQGLLDEGIHSFGAAVLRGKMELFENYPLNLGTGDWVEFYYYVYNILGDPSLSIWTQTPLSMSCDLPEEISLGQNYLDIYVPELDYGVVTAKMDHEFLVTDFIKDHTATLYFDPTTEGTITVTITAVNHLPLVSTVEVTASAIDPEITAVEPAGDVFAGETISVDLTLTNQGSESSAFAGELTELTGMADVLTEDLDFGTLEAGASATLTAEISISGECLNGYELSFLMTFDGIDNTIKFPLTVNNFILNPTEIVVNDANGILEPGETTDITVSIENLGSVAAEGLSATIISATTALTVNDSLYQIGDLAGGATGEAVFNVTANASGFNGRDAGIYLNLEDNAGRIYETSFNITIGIVSNTDPTGPCIGGYYAYDSFDTGYSEVPAYFWEEIDPDLGGSGEVILLEDDESSDIPLPFDFTYFDTVYDSITVCSNGWISFETTWQSYFRNWRIPSALGPYAQICAFWDDLLGPSEASEPLRLCYYYNADEHYFVIEWSDCYNRQDYVTPESFEIVLYDPSYPDYATESGNGEIQVNYQNVTDFDDDSNFCTIGIENQDQNDGVLYCYADQYAASATTLQNEMAIKFTTDAPDSFTGSDDTDLLPELPVLNSNYPNPFNPETTISFSLPESENVELAIYNIKGKKVKTLVSGHLNAGDHESIWYGKDENGKQVSSGVYFYKLKSGRHTTTKKCVLMK